MSVTYTIQMNSLSS